MLKFLKGEVLMGIVYKYKLKVSVRFDNLIGGTGTKHHIDRMCSSKRDKRRAPQQPVSELLHQLMHSQCVFE